MSRNIARRRTPKERSAGQGAPSQIDFDTRNIVQYIRGARSLQRRVFSFRVEARDLTGASEHAALALAAHFDGRA